MSPVTVLLPFRNAAATLEESIDSILAQSFADFELLAIDDGSEDGSSELVAAYAKDDRRLRLARQGRLGLVAALNLGLEKARAPLVARMDADDRMHPRRLELQYAFLSEHGDIDVVGCRIRPFPDSLVKGGLREYLRWQDSCMTPEDIAAEIYREAPLVNPGAMFRRDMALEMGGYRDGNFPEDYEFWLRLARAGKRLAKLDRVLLDWRISSASYSRRDDRFSRDSFDGVRADYLARDPRLLQGRPLVFWGAGRRTRRRSDLLIQRGHTPAAYVDVDPRKWGNRIRGVPVAPPDWLHGKDRPFVLSYVASHGAPELIAAQLQAMGYRRGNDYLVVG